MSYEIIKTSDSQNYLDQKNKVLLKQKTKSKNHKHGTGPKADTEINEMQPKAHVLACASSHLNFGKDFIQHYTLAKRQYL